MRKRKWKGGREIGGRKERDKMETAINRKECYI
jgi:hypothetical protein